MVYHRHVHFVVPGGGVSHDGSRWQGGPDNFLLPEKAASLVYRAKLRDALREAGLLEGVDPKVWKQTWVVDVEAVGDGRATLKYLAPYVYRAAITNNRIEAADESSVTYRVTPDPSLDITETPTCGMVSCFAWTVFRVTMSFYGVANDRLPLGSSDQGRGGSRVRNPRHSPGRRELPEADRQKGVWRITRVRPGSTATET